MIPTIKLKIHRKSVVKGKALVRFPATVEGSSSVTVAKPNGIYTFGADYTLLDASPVSDPANTIVAAYDEVSQSWRQTTLSALISGSAKIVQEITAAAPVSVLANVGIVKVNQSVGAAITLNMPLAAAKTCPVKI